MNTVLQQHRRVKPPLTLVMMSANATPSIYVINFITYFAYTFFFLNHCFLETVSKLL